MIITLVNLSSVADLEVIRAIRAINRQLQEDFRPYWDIDVALRFGTSGKSETDVVTAADLRSDAVVYLWDTVDIPGALGYHDQTARGIPDGYVFTEISDQLGESWTITLSHEVLEMAADANANKFAAGPHPTDPTRDVLYWYETCDAVQTANYAIDDTLMSDFVLPLYFTNLELPPTRLDFLFTAELGAFGVAPGGYAGYLDPLTGQTEIYTQSGDKTAQQRLEIKQRLGKTRRANRYASWARERKIPRGSWRPWEEEKRNG